MIKPGYFFLLSIIFPSLAFPQAYFETTTHRDTLCIDNYVEFENISPTDAEDYAWDFCAPDLSQPPLSSDISVPASAAIDGPAFISTFEAPEGIYAFITNFNDGTLTRLLFTDINLPPTAVNLGDFGGQIPVKPEGIKILQDDDGSFYGFIVGGQNPNFEIVRLDFGNSLINTPAVVDLTGIYSFLNEPKGLYFERSSVWVGFITNYGSETITRLTFNGGLNNIPVATQLTGIPLNRPIGIQLINDETGTWYAFISNSGGTVTDNYFVTRIQFTGTLEGSYTTDVINSSLFDRPFDITFFQNCDKIYGYVLNSFTNAVQMTFDGLLSGDPAFQSIPMQALSNPHGISELFRSENTINALISHTASSSVALSRIYYQSPCDASYHLWSDLFDPDPFQYPDTGHYNISLEAEYASGIKNYYCRPVYVVPNPHFRMGPDTVVCMGIRPILPVIPDSIGTIKFEEERYAYSDDVMNTYTVWRQYENEYMCTFNDSTQVIRYLKTVDLGPDREEVYGTPVTFDAGIYDSYLWNKGETSQQITVNKEGEYTVIVTSIGNCEQYDTVMLTYRIDVPNYITPNSSENNTWEIPLLQNYPNADVRIYDRYGNLVAAYKGADTGWDGTSHGRPLSSDAYWYYIDLNNGDKTFKGSVSVIR